MLKDIPLPMHRHPDFPKKDVAKKITETLAYEDVQFHNQNTKHVWGGWMYVEETKTK